MRKLLMFLLFVLWVFSTLVRAQTYVGGPIYQDSTWTLAGSPYIVTSDVTVGGTGGPTLTIEPGVEVRFNPETGLYVGGSSWGHLRAQGTESERIIFTSASEMPAPGDWKGIYIGQYTYTDTLSYCDILYAGGSGGFSTALYLRSYSSGSTHYNKVVNHCSIQYSGSTGIYSTNPQQGVVIKNSAINNNQGAGISFSAHNYSTLVESCLVSTNGTEGIIMGGVYSSGCVIRANTFSGNGSYPLGFDYIPAIPELRDNTYLNNGEEFVRISDGSDITMYISSVLCDDGEPYLITGDLMVEKSGLTGPPTLTIEPGVEVRFNPETGLYVGGSSWGHLRAQGTESERIVFTSASQTPAPGDWDGIAIDQWTYTDTLSYCDILYAGGTGGYSTGLYLRSYSSGYYKVIEHCNIQNSGSTGIYSQTSQEGVVIKNSAISNNQGAGIYFTSLNYSTLVESCLVSTNGTEGITVGGVYSSGCVIRANTFSGNGSYPLGFDYIPAIPELRDNTYLNNGEEFIRISDGSDRIMYISSVLCNDGEPYLITGDLKVEKSGLTGPPTLTIEPGVEIRFNAGTGLYVGGSNWGHLRAQGTESERIVFTSASQTPAPGDWDGIAIDQWTYTDTLSYCDILYAGGTGGYSTGLYLRSYSSGYYKVIEHCNISYSSSSGIRCRIGSVVRNSTISANETYGIYSYTGYLVVGNDPANYCDVYGNGLYNLYNASSYTADARYNFWGTTDPDEIEAKIYGNVDYIPWSEEPRFPDLWFAPTLVSPANYVNVYENPTFVWYPVLDATNYQIVLALDYDLTGVVWSKTVFEGTQVAYDGTYILENYQSYYWSVRAYIDDEWKNYASPFEFTKYPVGELLATPSLRSPTNGSEITLPEIFSWFDVDGADRYQLEIASDQEFNDKLWDGLTNVASLQVPGNISGIVDGMSYYWRVRGIDDGGNPGYYSTPNDFTKVVSVPVPDAPVLTEPEDGTTVTSQTIVFSWSQPSGATSYTLQYSIAPDFPNNSNETWTIEEITANSYVVTLPEADIGIYWHVLASNSAGSSQYSTAYQFQYNYSTAPEIKSVVIDRPQTGIQVAKGTELIAHAYFVGNYDGEVAGEWLVNRVFTGPINFTMDHAQGYELDSPLLPTDEIGIDTVEVYVFTPNIIYSNKVIYQVYEKQLGPPAQLFLAANPCIILADGIATSTISAFVQDDNGNLIVNDNGREVTFSVDGEGILPDPPTASTINGVATISLTSTETPDDNVIVSGNSSGLASAQVRIITADTDLEGDLALFDAYVNRLEHLTLEIYTEPFNVGILQPYDEDQAQVFVNTYIRDQTPPPERVESFRRLLLAERVLNESYYYKPNPNFPDDYEHEIPGVLQMWDDVARNAAYGIAAAVACAGILNSKVGLTEKESFAKKALKWLIKQIVSFQLKLTRAMLNLIRSEEIRNVLNTVVDVLTKYFTSLVTDSPGDLLPAIYTPLVRFNATERALSYYCQTTQHDLDRAVNWAENNDYLGDFQVAQNQVTVNIEGTRILTEQAHSDILSYEELAQSIDAVEEMQQVLNSFWTDPGDLLKHLWNLVKSLFSVQEYYYNVKAVGEGCNIASDVRDKVESGIYSAFGQPLTLNKGAIFLSKSNEVLQYPSRQSLPKQELYVNLLQTFQQEATDFEDVARQMINALNSSDSAAAAELLPELMASDDTLSLYTQLVMAAIGASARAALLTIPNFQATYDSTFTICANSGLQRTLLVFGVLTWLVNLSDPTLQPQAIDQADLAISSVNEADQWLSATLTELFTTPAYPLVMTTSYYHPDSVRCGETFQVNANITNASAGIATNVFLRLAPDPTLSIVSSDSIFLGELEAGEYRAVSFQLEALIPDSLPSLDSASTQFGIATLTPFSDNAITYPHTIIQMIYYYYVSGDANGDGEINLADAVYLVNYLFIGGPPPDPLEAGDANCSGDVDLADAVYIINYLFIGGPPPCS